MVVPPVAGAVIRQKIWSMAQVAKGFGKEVIQVLPQL
jgi:hypothetical protein